MISANLRPILMLQALFVFLVGCVHLVELSTFSKIPDIPHVHILLCMNPENIFNHDPRLSLVVLKVVARINISYLHKFHSPTKA